MVYRTCVFLLLLSSISFSQKPQRNGSLRDAMIAYTDSLLQRNYGMVGFYRHGKSIEKRAIGRASATEAMTPDKVFNIGSLTKTFTAILIMQEVEKGSIALSDSLHLYFPPGMVRNKNVNLNITIRQLLDHRSGLGEVLVDSLANDAFSNPYSSHNYEFLFNRIPPSSFKPGQKLQYTNTNYLLLGYLLEVVNDKPYADLLQERIFRPCEMTNTYSYYSKAIPGAAHPMLAGKDLFEYVNFHFYRNYAFSAGCISSNLDDLVRFFDHLYRRNTLVSKESFQKMTSFQDRYGLGLIEYKFGGKVYYGHGGDNISFRVRNYYDPQTGDLLILMSNQYKDPFIEKVRAKLLD